MSAMGYSADDYDEFYGKGDYALPREQQDIAATTDRPRGCSACLGTSDIAYRTFYFGTHFAIALFMGLTKRCKQRCLLANLPGWCF
jgi:hypothetical protein